MGANYSYPDFLSIYVFTFTLSFLKDEFTQGYNQKFSFYTNKDIKIINT